MRVTRHTKQIRQLPVSCLNIFLSTLATNSTTYKCFAQYRIIFREDNTRKFQSLEKKNVIVLLMQYNSQMKVSFKMHFINIFVDYT